MGQRFCGKCGAGLVERNGGKHRWPCIVQVGQSGVKAKLLGKFLLNAGRLKGRADLKKSDFARILSLRAGERLLVECGVSEMKKGRIEGVDPDTALLGNAFCN